MTNATRTTPPPPAAPAMIATWLLEELLDGLLDGLLDELVELDDGEAVAVSVAVIVTGVLGADNGELTLRYEESETTGETGTPVSVGTGPPWPVCTVITDA